MQKSKQDKPLDNKQVFLLLFARELIRNSEEGLLQLKGILERETKTPTEEIPVVEIPPEEISLEETSKPNLRIIGKDQMIRSILSQAPRINPNGEFSAIMPMSITPQRKEIYGGYRQVPYPILTIPEPKLPEEFKYLKPVASTKEIELGKINPLINDPAIKKIECDGPNKPIVVSGNMGRKETEIVLTNSEVEEIVDRFSKAARIPTDIGLFRVVVGNLIFSAIISDVVPSRFMITKMSPNVQMSFKPIPPPVIPAVNMNYSNYLNPVNVPVKGVYNLV